MFVQPCFIRKFSMNLIDELKKIGMTHKQCIVSKYFPYIFVNRGFYSLNDFGSKEEIERAIDCGTNEDLFLAIAALRDDTDKNQWFVIPKIKTIRLPGCFGQTIGMDGHQQIIDGYEWHLSDEDGISKKVQSYIEDGEDEKFLPHKATIKELIEHFK